jgi:hypothetical protein
MKIESYSDKKREEPSRFRRLVCEPHALPTYIYIYIYVRSTADSYRVSYTSLKPGARTMPMNSFGQKFASLSGKK